MTKQDAQEYEAIKQSYAGAMAAFVITFALFGIGTVGTIWFIIAG